MNHNLKGIFITDIVNEYNLQSIISEVVYLYTKKAKVFTHWFPIDLEVNYFSWK